MKQSGPPPAKRRIALSQAVSEAAKRLKLSADELGAIVGVSPSVAARLLSGEDCLRESTKQWELSVHFVEIYRSLFALTGGDDHLAQCWLHAANRALGGARPIDLVKSTDGLVYVCGYLGERHTRT